MSSLGRGKRPAQGFGRALEACWICTEEQSFVHINATGEPMPRDEYARRWPHHPPLKRYTDARMVNTLASDWSDAPPPRSSADV